MADAALFHHRGRYLVALGHYYHPEEFTCCQCRKVLDEGGFFEEKGSIFCPKCYDTRYAPSCAKCKKKITGVSVPQSALHLPSLRPAYPCVPRSVPSRPAAGISCSFQPSVGVPCGVGCSLLADCSSLPGGHACAEDDLARAVLHLRSLQNSHPQPCLLHGGGTALL